MEWLLDRMLRALIRHGTLRVIWPNGRASTFGDGGAPAAALRLSDGATVRRILRQPQLAIGEAYMEGGLAPEGCDIRDVLLVLTDNLATTRVFRRAGLRLRWARWRRDRTATGSKRARRNVAHHYDLDARLYEMILDADRQYSCAYFPAGDETLEQAQAEKKAHIAAKLKLDRPGLRVLDIGCGWGGLALSLARDHGADVTGITLSTEQLEVARARADAAGLGGRVRFAMCDYREVAGPFDRIVSVGMFEHVGVASYPAYFVALHRCLAPDGVALLHTIGNSKGPSVTNPWLAKYIFPDGYSPALSEVLPAIERGALIVTDIEVWRLHYARTLRHWRDRFDAHGAEIEALYDARRRRMFEFYLSGAELAFVNGGEVVFQIQLAKAVAILPTTRDYMTGRPARRRDA